MNVHASEALIDTHDRLVTATVYEDADLVVTDELRGVCVDLNEDAISTVRDALELSDETYQQIVEFLRRVL